MSRMQLHRKLNALTGMSTTEFIRMERLKLAKKLLEQNHSTVSEITYSVGFSSPSYFSKCFKEVYQCTPSEFLSK
ncbi:helix-turn-helix transcriptional regulator [Snuella lapsa]|uniref:helix-turn-helix domain-containing protein n=1 Tax=Snuella lapsa TaxID=870481 RepID=UPI0031ED5B8C